jgi:threonine dehydrogenase-like Zn-dependent dehydrogenase
MTTSAAPSAEDRGDHAGTWAVGERVVVPFQIRCGTLGVACQRFGPQLWLL